MQGNQVKTPKTPLTYLWLEPRSSLRKLLVKPFFVVCWLFGHDYWVSLDGPVHGPLLFECKRCPATNLVIVKDGDFTVTVHDSKGATRL